MHDRCYCVRLPQTLFTIKSAKDLLRNKSNLLYRFTFGLNLLHVLKVKCSLQKFFEFFLCRWTVKRLKDITSELADFSFHYPFCGQHQSEKLRNLFL